MQWRLGVAGSPIAHSLSPQLHAAGLALAGLTGTSERYEIDAAHASRLGELLGQSVDALSITMPLKSAAHALCDELDEDARALGVVNSLLWRENRLWGAATDGPGFVDSLRGEFGVDVEGMYVVILGAGGAARAIVEAVARQGAHSISVLGRTPSRVAEIVERHDSVFEEMVLYRPVDLIVNTTPSHGRGPTSTLMQGVSRETIAIDITYDPRMSDWLALHADHGCRHRNGLAMLAYQAARQMNWWWDSALEGAELLEVIR